MLFAIMERISAIYKITNLINKKVYIGSTRNFRIRKKDHFSMLKNQKHPNPFLQKAWNKYGEQNFRVEIICYCEVKFLLRFEQKCLDVYQSYLPKNGYNICRIASNPMIGRKHSEETKRKMSLSKNGSKNHQFGKLHIQETKQKISDSHKKKKIERIDPNTGEIKEYAGIRIAEREGFISESICRCCKNKQQKHKGYYWKYVLQT